MPLASILFHTHPSGDPTPSAEDVSFTRRMCGPARFVGVRLVDHLILGNGGRWASLQRLGELPSYLAPSDSGGPRLC